MAMKVMDRPATELVDIVRGEFQELPGLTLTKPQVERLWALDTDTCDAVLQLLLDEHCLKRTAGGAYVRFDVGC
jgi:hypothetical protein